MNNSSDFFSSNKNNKHKNKNKHKVYIDEESKDINKLNKSFKQRKREIEEEEIDLKNWEEYLDY
jgi:hypothetical protein